MSRAIGTTQLGEMSKANVKAAYGEWFDSLGEFTYFVTRTFRDKPVEEGSTYTEWGLGHARKCLADLYTVTDAVRAVSVFEFQKNRGGVPHIHSVIEADRRIDFKKQANLDYYQWGISKWENYVLGAGATAYLGKYLSKEMVEMYVHIEKPKLAHSRYMVEWQIDINEGAKPAKVGYWTVADVERTRV